ncbi:hypothetical protein BP6252_02618 [Coleophoma cylindrospora]|uniref:Nucleoporin Nup159/Nup146 N-terminal domain-containing protein n=1 Tax=Coleophoma cylindrospora TaxID=1849047 RepID=A0A3D8SGZ5_9HELO|nr:hypothetical protein BP6252_02618 [Coleophoma cylindrospora]
MAFSFGNAAAAAAAGPNTQSQAGPDLEDIQTEALGFLALAGESKLQLLPTPWPSDNLPQPTASLLSVASRKGLVAAAGPDVVIIATTESVRKAFEGPSSGGSNLKPFQPQLTLPMPMRISQLAFSSDETYLVLSAAEGGGLAVYDVQAILQGSTESAFQMSTNGQALRALIPNPSPERGEFIAVVTNDGNLMMANLKERSFVPGTNGQVLKDGVSCLSWSTQGKQLVAGLGSGSAIQMTPDGTVKAEIPVPPNMEPGHHTSSITWLENNVFLLVHTPSSFDNSSAPTSIYHVATRQPPSNFTFQKIADPAPPFGLNRSPPHHFLQRLRNFPPNIQDLIIVASTASTDIGLFSRSKVPLSGDKPADKITGVFTMTEMADDSRRAQLPMTGDLGDTSPIGIALDLSSKEKVVKPIPSDEMSESPTPLPGIMVLNNEGVLASWWVVYSESIRQGTVYPGLVIAEGVTQSAQGPAASSQPTPSAFGAPPAQPAFGQSAFGTPSTAAPAFGSASKVGSFGAPSGLGQTQSPWGAASTTAAPSSGPVFGSSTFGSTPASNSQTNKTPAFGSSTFGTPSTAAPASGSAFATPAFGSASTPGFGTSGLPGSRPSPWASAAGTAPASAFGQPSGLGKSTSVFGSVASNPASSGANVPSSGGFASFAQQGGFAAAAAPGSGSIFGSNNSTTPKSTGGSIFGAKPDSATTANVFGKPSSPAPAAGIFGGPKPTTSIFGTPSTAQASNPFGAPSQTNTSKSESVFGSNKFVLNSTFNADKSSEVDTPKSTADADKSLFGGAFGSALGEVSKPSQAEAAVSQETDMNDDNAPEVSKSEEVKKEPSTTPMSTPAPSKFTSSTPASTSLFGSSTLTSATPMSKPVSSAGFGFGKPSMGGINIPPLETKTPEKLSNLSFFKKEPETEKKPSEALKGIPDAPLPPDSTTKPSFDNASGSSISNDAPLPPDFIPKPAIKTTETVPATATEPKATSSISADLIPPSDVPGGPEEGDDESDFLTEEDDSGNPSGEESEEEEEGSEEGSGEDVTKDLSPPQSSTKTVGFTPQSSFGGPASQSPVGGLFTNMQRPKQPNAGRSLFGEINQSAPVLPPPKLMASPRSPSPIRSAVGRLQRPDATRSVSLPGGPSHMLQKQAAKPTAPAQNLSFLLEQQRAEEQRRAAKRAQKEAEEKQALVDDEDEMTQKFLSSEITATRTLDDFVAHSDYVSTTAADSIPAQVETVYRDINSMIDTLGINARALKSFMKGHTEQYKEEGRTRQDLEDEQDWVLVEIEDLGSVLSKDLAHDLEAGRVQGVAAKLEACSDLQKELTRLFARFEDIKKLVLTHVDAEYRAIARAQPLSAEQAAQQHDLRKQFKEFQELLAKAEEELTVLKAAITSQSGGNNGKPVPTVEAVVRTITKMTSMAEKRSGDIDVLENQMRKLRFSSAASSREGSPFATPQHRASTRIPGSSTYGLLYTPDNLRESSRNLQNSLMSSTSSFTRGSPPKKKMSLFSPEEKAQLRSKLARKKDVSIRLRAALHKTGTIVRSMDDDDD